MTANQVFMILAPIALLCLVAIYAFLLRRRHQILASEKQSHKAHAPSAGYNAYDIARSKGMGQADGGDG
ncbi:hypothetical protein FIU86_18265 [Roseovarius sp. THAF9]|uniref:hypothetical protein n=1 Tax=Roseovarius sp. THAF9 TaxID=2587847 RepID=UPI0012697855|nr:hypothetical protein [Roseovarius sp. THAF9]QFT94802.1 hypothetical protein FIU86_18265 [Roseovarius sp. THAF9]